MNNFLWISGHLGWGSFALIVFTVLWFLLTDIVWRLRSASIRWLAAMMSIGWMMGVGLIFIAFHLGSR
ncbi:hypothetical protein ASD68_08780 [Rhodanobacter sp. Root627]|uniref:hypothetical protein n=1 Tax=Rhodanobacter sp. Root627 TaxID=1736572 RepID=UPI0006FF3D40|nr:hypothetical protein [Rhodanobacter sp. Root627]KRA33130.1 hypothetical protein ASD68_08780 [Rhodanobacter sp. Root627]